MSEASSAPPPNANPKGGRVMVVVIFVAVIGVFAVIAGIGYHHATRNRRKHGEQDLPGAQLYNMYCERCHLPDGSGKPPYPALTRPLSLEEFTLQVQKGKNDMPAFEKTFRGPEYAKLFEFVKGLQGLR